MIETMVSFEILRKIVKYYAQIPQYTRTVYVIVYVNINKFILDNF